MGTPARRIIRLGDFRAVLSLVLAAALCPSRLPASLFSGVHDASAQAAALASPAQQILNAAGGRIERDHQRTAANSPFVLIPARHRAADYEQALRRPEASTPQPVSTPSIHHGRSPPGAIS